MLDLLTKLFGGGFRSGGFVPSAGLGPNERATLLRRGESWAVVDIGAPGKRAGDEWEPLAREMLEEPLAKIQLDGCMAEVENLKAVGRCIRIERTPDGGAPKARVIWQAHGKTDDGEHFQVIVARCAWNNERARYEERF